MLAVGRGEGDRVGVATRRGVELVAMMAPIDADKPAYRWGLERSPVGMTAVPTLTAEQRREALRQAMAARSARKLVLDAIAHEQETIAAVLAWAKTDPVVGRIKVTALLARLPGYGPTRVSALMQRIGIAPSRRVAGLGERQRQALCDALAATR